MTEPGVATTRCIGCGGLIPSMEGPTHRYMESSPGCWHFFGEVLAREYSDPSFAAVHRLTVDSYAVQHPGQPSPQSIQSVCVHLMSLCLVLERGGEAGYATRAIQEAVRREDRYVWLTPPPSLGSVTVADVVYYVDALGAPEEGPYVGSECVVRMAGTSRDSAQMAARNVSELPNKAIAEYSFSRLQPHHPP